MGHFEHIVILTGAGISAESGLNTFRDRGGIWEQYDPMELARPEAFAAMPQRVLEFYNLRRTAAQNVAPNAAHLALARLEKEYRGHVDIITQNVDGLHKAAGSESVLHMHGELNKVRCTACGTVQYWPNDLTLADQCPACRQIGRLRPHIVWFGEIPHHLPEIDMLLSECDLFISIGTSGTVYPAAGFVSAVRARGQAHTIELNLAPSEGQSQFAAHQYGPASEIVPAYVDSLLAVKDSV